MLHGNRTTESDFMFSPSIEEGNKHFIVTSKVNFYGKRRSDSSRLRQPA